MSGELITEGLFEFLNRTAEVGDGLVPVNMDLKSQRTFKKIN